MGILKNEFQSSSVSASFALVEQSDIDFFCNAFEKNEKNHGIIEI